MKAVILAGGYAKRFWPVTIHKPKPLLPIAGKPIIDFIMEKLEEVPEIDTVYISTNESFKDHFADWMKNRKSPKRVELVVEPARKEDHKFGSVGGLAYAIKKKNVKSDVMLVAGDNIFSFNLKAFADYHPKDPRIILHTMDDMSRCSRYGVVQVDESMQVIDFEEKPDDPKTNLVSTACYVFPKDSLPLLREYLSGQNPVDKMGSFLEWLHKRTPVRGFLAKGYWYDIGDEHYYVQANINAMKESDGDSMVLGAQHHSRITRSYIGKGSTIKNSAIKECVIFDNVHIENCVLRECIVDDHTHIENVDLNDSLIAAHTKLKKQKIIKSRRFFLPPVTGQELLKP